MELVSPSSPGPSPIWRSAVGEIPLCNRPAVAAPRRSFVGAAGSDELADFAEQEELLVATARTARVDMLAQFGPAIPPTVLRQHPQPEPQQRAPPPQRPPQQRPGFGGDGGAMKVRLATREPGISAFASHRGRAAQRGKIDEAKTLSEFWEAVHHGGRTLYGQKCHDLRSFWSAVDREGTESILGTRLSDALVRLGLGLTKPQAKALVEGIAVDVPGTCDYHELQGWVEKRRQEGASRQKDKVSGRGWGAAAAAAASVAKEPSRATTQKGTQQLPQKNSLGKNAPGGTFGAAARPSLAKKLCGWESDREDEPHEFLRRQTEVKLPIHNPTIVTVPVASQLAAAILMHEKGYEERAAAHKKDLVVRLKSEQTSARIARLQKHEEAQVRTNHAVQQRQKGLAKQFKLGSIAAEEWKEVEAEIEHKVERREKKKVARQEKMDDPERVKQRKAKRRVLRMGAALRIQAWLRGAYVRRVVVLDLKKERERRLKRLAFQERKRLETVGSVLDGLVATLERQELEEKWELVAQLQQLQQQQAELDEAAMAFMNPTVSEAKREEARRYADAVQAEGIPQKQTRWSKYKAWVSIAETREATAKAIASGGRQRSTSLLLPVLFEREWLELNRGEQAAATRLGFKPECWPKLESNEPAAVPWAFVHGKLGLGRVADLLGLTERNWPKVAMCKPVPKPVYKIGEPTPDHSTAATGAEEDETVSGEETASLAVRLHKLALYLSVQQTAVLKKQVRAEPPTDDEMLKDFDRLCTGLQPAINEGLPDALAQMMREGLTAVAWAGGGADPDPEPEPEQEPEQEEKAEAAERERELARQLSEMKAVMALALGHAPPAQLDEVCDDMLTAAEPEPEPEESSFQLTLRHAEEVLVQLDRLSGITEPIMPAVEDFGLRAGAAGGRDLANFLREAVKQVHSLRAEQHSTFQDIASGAGSKSTVMKRPVGSVVAELIQLAITRIGAPDASIVLDEEVHGGALWRVQHRLVDAFRFFDRNGDSKISPKELQLAMRSLSADNGKGDSKTTLSMKEITKFMKESDANGDGSLDYAEFVAHFHFQHAETARKAAETEEAKLKAKTAFEQGAAKKLMAARKARLAAAAAAAAAEIAAKEHEESLANEAARVLPGVFSKPYWALGMAKEAAACRLGFTESSWPRLPRAAAGNAVWKELGTLRRMTIVLGFDERQQPPAWELVELEGHGPKKPAQSIWAAHIRAAHIRAAMVEESRLQKVREQAAARKRAAEEAAKAAADAIARKEEEEDKKAREEAQVRLIELAALPEQAAEQDKQIFGEDEVEGGETEKCTMNGQDKARFEQIWSWVSAGGIGKRALDRAQLARFFDVADDIELTDQLWERMCSLLQISGEGGMTRAMLLAQYEAAEDPAGMIMADFSVRCRETVAAIRLQAVVRGQKGRRRAAGVAEAREEVHQRSATPDWSPVLPSHRMQYAVLLDCVHQPEQGAYSSAALANQGGIAMTAPGGATYAQTDDRVSPDLVSARLVYSPDEIEDQEANAQVITQRKALFKSAAAALPPAAFGLDVVAGPIVEALPYGMALSFEDEPAVIHFDCSDLLKGCRGEDALVVLLRKESVDGAWTLLGEYEKLTLSSSGIATVELQSFCWLQAHCVRGFRAGFNGGLNFTDEFVGVGVDWDADDFVDDWVENMLSMGYYQPQETQSTWVSDLAAEQGFFGISKGAMGYLVHGVASVRVSQRRGGTTGKDGRLFVQNNKGLVQRLALAIYMARSAAEDSMELEEQGMRAAAVGSSLDAPGGVSKLLVEDKEEEVVEVEEPLSTPAVQPPPATPREPVEASGCCVVM